MNKFENRKISQVIDLRWRQRRGSCESGGIVGAEYFKFWWNARMVVFEYEIKNDRAQHNGQIMEPCR